MVCMVSLDVLCMNAHSAPMATRPPGRRYCASSVSALIGSGAPLLPSAKFRSAGVDWSELERVESELESAGVDWSELE